MLPDRIEGVFDREYRAACDRAQITSWFSARWSVPKLLYLLLCERFHRPTDLDKPESLKIWPFDISIQMPELIRRRNGLIQRIQIQRFEETGKDAIWLTLKAWWKIDDHSVASRGDRCGVSCRRPGGYRWPSCLLSPRVPHTCAKFRGTSILVGRRAARSLRISPPGTGLHSDFHASRLDRVDFRKLANSSSAAQSNRHHGRGALWRTRDFRSLHLGEIGTGRQLQPVFRLVSAASVQAYGAIRVRPASDLQLQHRSVVVAPVGVGNGSLWILANVTNSSRRTTRSRLDRKRKSLRVGSRRMWST